MIFRVLFMFCLLCIFFVSTSSLSPPVLAQNVVNLTEENIRAYEAKLEELTLSELLKPGRGRRLRSRPVRMFKVKTVFSAFYDREESLKNLGRSYLQARKDVESLSDVFQSKLPESVLSQARLTAFRNLLMAYDLTPRLSSVHDFLSLQDVMFSSRFELALSPVRFHVSLIMLRDIVLLQSKSLKPGMFENAKSRVLQLLSKNIWPGTAEDLRKKLSAEIADLALLQGALLPYVVIPETTSLYRENFSGGDFAFTYTVLTPGELYIFYGNSRSLSRLKTQLEAVPDVSVLAPESYPDLKVEKFFSEDHSRSGSFAIASSLRGLSLLYHFPVIEGMSRDEALGWLKGLGWKPSFVESAAFETESVPGLTPDEVLLSGTSAEDIAYVRFQ